MGSEIGAMVGSCIGYSVGYTIGSINNYIKQPGAQTGFYEEPFAQYGFVRECVKISVSELTRSERWCIEPTENKKIVSECCVQ